jgi:Fic-DOC domain mobile mystery protein B
MFGRTWQWSGTYRQTEKNIGIDPRQIAVAVRDLTRDCRSQIAAADMPFDEIAARFHHRLVWIHPFPNGNGRHARLAVDTLLESHGHECFSWGATDLAVTGPVRVAYIEALRQADQRNYRPLMSFVRS